MRLDACYTRTVLAMVHALTAVALLSLLSMMAITCVDVVMRVGGRPLIGAYDLVAICAFLTVVCALPYATAVKGHVAIEFFFHKFGRRGRVVVDTINRMLGIALFATLAWRAVIYAEQKRSSGEVSMTLALPVWPVIYVLAAACLVVALVILHNLLHPGKEMIKP